MRRFIASSPENSARQANQPMKTHDEIQDAMRVVRHFYDYLNAKAGDDWAEILATGWAAVPPFPESPDQATGYRSTVDQLRAGVPDLVVEVVEIFANEDVVAVRSRASGTNTGTLFGNPPTGKTFAFTAMDIHRLSNGKIVQTWHVEDFAGLMAQLS